MQLAPVRIFVADTAATARFYYDVVTRHVFCKSNDRVISQA